MEFKEIYDTMLSPGRSGGFGRAWSAGKNRLASVKLPAIPVRSESLRGAANQLSRLIWRFNIAVNRALITYREPVLDMQLIQERIAGAAMEMYASACVLSRRDAELQTLGRNGGADSSDHSAAEYFLQRSFRNIRRFLAELNDHDDKALLGAARAALGASNGAGANGSRPPTATGTL
jgi:hypothetical protein